MTFMIKIVCLNISLSIKSKQFCFDYIGVKSFPILFNFKKYSSNAKKSINILTIC